MPSGDIHPKGGRESGPVENINQEREITLAQRLLELGERGSLGHFQIVGMADDKIQIAGVVCGPIDAAAVRPDLFIGNAGNDQSPQLAQVFRPDFEGGINHGSGAGFHKA